MWPVEVNKAKLTDKRNTKSGSAVTSIAPHDCPEPVDQGDSQTVFPPLTAFKSSLPERRKYHLISTHFVMHARQSVGFFQQKQGHHHNGDQAAGRPHMIIIIIIIIITNVYD